MQLPFLKNKKNQTSIASPIQIERTSDTMADRALAEGAAEELLQAIEIKDFTAMREALRALISIIQHQDEIQDAPTPR